ncbi:MAG: hypothetical protein KJO35_02175 [Gammaproteobacteria bacterium]|nr:hypothetical protein [Gammaproteobacteria bacterium]
MTQHEYVFIAISVILGLAITRLLNSVAELIRAHKRVSFHWSTALWGGIIMIFILQLWWVGWELNTVDQWAFTDFVALVTGAIFVYGAAELALPTEDYDIADDDELDFLAHSRSFGRLSALSMMGYFCLGPLYNLTMFSNPVLPSLIFPAVGGTLMFLIALKPLWFAPLTVIFAVYGVLVLLLTV